MRLNTNMIAKTGNGATRVPMKLVAGMAVVVFIKPEYVLLAGEISAGIVKETWLEGTVSSYMYNSFLAVEIAGRIMSTVVPGLIIVRSTKLEHNLKPSKIRTKLERQAKQQRREILASVKVVKSEVK